MEIPLLQKDRSLALGTLGDQLGATESLRVFLLGVAFVRRRYGAFLPVFLFPLGRGSLTIRLFVVEYIAAGAVIDHRLTGERNAAIGAFLSRELLARRTQAWPVVEIDVQDLRADLELITHAQ
jgi:hypothetical protein